MGKQKETLQRAIQETENYLGPLGLKCSPAKSEMLIMSRRQANIQLLLDNTTIPRLDKIRILGMWIQENGRDTEAINILEITTNQSCRLLRRIANKNAGTKEANLLRLVHSFVISRITYAIPYLNTTKSERDKVDIRKSIKHALGPSRRAHQLRRFST